VGLVQVEDAFDAAEHFQGDFVALIEVIQELALHDKHFAVKTRQRFRARCGVGVEVAVFVHGQGRFEEAIEAFAKMLDLRGVIVGANRGAVEERDGSFANFCYRRASFTS
jgi:hypothetical protein